MVYHSYIDYMLEVQVRRANEDPTKEAYNSMINFTELAFNYNENNKRFAHNNDLETLLQVFHWQNNLQSFDEYPLMEWIDTESIISFNEARKEGIKFTTNYQENVNFQSCKTYGEYVFYNEKIR